MHASLGPWDGDGEGAGDGGTGGGLVPPGGFGTGRPAAVRQDGPGRPPCWCACPYRACPDRAGVLVVTGHNAGFASGGPPGGCAAPDDTGTGEVGRTSLIDPVTNSV